MTYRLSIWVVAVTFGIASSVAMAGGPAGDGGHGGTANGGGHSPSGSTHSDCSQKGGQRSNAGAGGSSEKAAAIGHGVGGAGGT